MRTLLKDASQPFWVKECDVPGVTNGDPTVEYEIRIVTRTAAKEIATRNVVKEIDPHQRRVVDVVKTDDIDLDLLDYVLVNWRGIVSDGEPVACTTESKRIFAEQNVGISRSLISLCCETPRAEEARAATFRESA